MTRHVYPGKKRLEEVLAADRFDSQSGVTDADLGLSLLSPRGSELNLPTVGRELYCVEQEMLDTIADLARLDAGGAQVGGQGEFQLLPALLHERADVGRRLL